MIKFTRLLFTLLFAVIVLSASAQSTATTSSPYSRYGLGDISDQLLPQNIGMGGISVATNTIGGYNSINIINPASYGKLSFTTIDAGVSTNTITLSKVGYPDERNTNVKLSHLLFALPITKHSALSFGLIPYSEMGYSYKQTNTRPNPNPQSPADTNAVNVISSGDGGLSKAYFGYGVTLFKHLLIGANFSYIFGSLQQDQSTEIPTLYGVLDSRAELDDHVKGVNYDYGAQYIIDFSDTKHLTLGYSASANTKLDVTVNNVVSQYTRDASGNENNALDSLKNTTTNGKIQLPQINRFGISYQQEGKFMVGADYTMGKWSNLSIAGVNAGLQDSKMFNVGGSWTPNSNALNNYFALMDYRLGFIYEQTYLNVQADPNVAPVNLKRYAVTFGVGIPLPHDRASSAFYKVNFSAEIGQRGQLADQLIKENYVNLHLGFTLNDRWFQRFKFE